MPTATDLEERATWTLEQAGYAVTAESTQGSSVTHATGDTITMPASRDALRRLANAVYGVRQRSML